MHCMPLFGLPALALLNSGLTFMRLLLVSLMMIFLFHGVFFHINLYNVNSSALLFFYFVPWFWCFENQGGPTGLAPRPRGSAALRVVRSQEVVRGYRSGAVTTYDTTSRYPILKTKMVTCQQGPSQSLGQTVLRPSFVPCGIFTSHAVARWSLAPLALLSALLSFFFFPSIHRSLALLSSSLSLSMYKSISPYNLQGVLAALNARTGSIEWRRHFASPSSSSSSPSSEVAVVGAAAGAAAANQHVIDFMQPFTPVASSTFDSAPSAQLLTVLCMCFFFFCQHTALNLFLYLLAALRCSQRDLFSQSSLRLSSLLVNLWLLALEILRCSYYNMKKIDNSHLYY